MFCGIDWASERHAVCVLDDAGRKATTFEVAHTGDGFDHLAEQILRMLGTPYDQAHTLAHAPLPVAGLPEAR